MQSGPARSRGPALKDQTDGRTGGVAGCARLIDAARPRGGRVGSIADGADVFDRLHAQYAAMAEKLEKR